VELRLDLPIGHDTIPFEDIQGFVRLAELGGAAPSDPVIGVGPDRIGVPGGEHDTGGGPEALRIEVHAPAEWDPCVSIDKRLGLRTLCLLLSLRDTDGDTDGDTGKHRAELIEITDELLRVITD
jgi:hypothetical protein